MGFIIKAKPILRWDKLVILGLISERIAACVLIMFPTVTHNMVHLSYETQDMPTSLENP